MVVFSQWLRMHELLRAAARRTGSWEHVLFHGGVPGRKRKDLVDRFRDDPKCRAFLSTDAGGVGLNLQHASVVLNMDLPWNPAVLEQRIGRVHRLGQRQPVRVVNFVAQGTIEEGMLAVLKFKKSLFAGVLDGGEKEVFLGGSRLNKFMETVESATSAIPEPMAEDAAEAAPSAPTGGTAPTPGAEADGEEPKPAVDRGGGRSVDGAVAGGDGVVAAVHRRFAAELRRRIGFIDGSARRAHWRSLSQECRCRSRKCWVRRCKPSRRCCRACRSDWTTHRVVATRRGSAANDALPRRVATTRNYLSSFFSAGGVGSGAGPGGVGAGTVSGGLGATTGVNTAWPGPRKIVVLTPAPFGVR